MIVRDDLVDALEICIDRINQGESVQTVVADYPVFAKQLRPMLEAGLLLPRSRFPADVVSAAATQGEARIRATVSDTFAAGTNWLAWGLALLFIGAGVSLFIFILISNQQQSAAPPPVLTNTPTLTLAPTASATLSPTATYSPTATSTPTVTQTPTQSRLPQVLPASETPLPSRPGLTIIEGPVSQINGNVITIFDREITLAEDDPLLPAIQLQDIVRIESANKSDTIEAISITLINVTVVVSGDQFWRSDNCNVPPPVWAQSQANAWYARCTPQRPADAQPGGRNTGHDDDDDDDDD